MSRIGLKPVPLPAGVTLRETDGHVEVKGLIGDFAEAVVIESEADFSKLPAAPRYGVVSQTTQPIERVKPGALRALMAREHGEAWARYLAVGAAARAEPRVARDGPRKISKM